MHRAVRRCLPPPGPQLAPHRVPCLRPQQQAYAFDQPLSWDTSSVTNMEYMFEVRALPAPRASPICTVTCPLPGTLRARRPQLIVRPSQRGCRPHRSRAIPNPHPPALHALPSRQNAAGGRLIAPNFTGTFTSKADLEAAVTWYDEDVAAAIATYGAITGWDTSGVTDMSNLFKELRNFNADIYTRRCGLIHRSRRCWRLVTRIAVH